MASRRRTSPKAEPLDLDHELDEMYSSAITRPNLGFLRVTESPTLSITSPAGNSGVLDASSMDTPSVDGVIFPTRSDDVEAIDGPAIDVTSEDPPSMDVRPIGKWKIHHCLTVQDGHSANEQLLYEMLWRSAREVNPDERILAISREDMASQIRITVRNVKGVLDRLIEKLALERVIESNSFARKAATYRIYSYRAILERRRQAGFEWVTRANGVKFISSQMAQELLSRPKFTEADPRQPGAARVDVPSKDHLTTAVTTKDGGSPVTASMDRRSAVPPELGPGLRKINPVFDNAAVALLWRECRTRVPDCTVDEVLQFSNLKAAGIWADKNIRNTIALLLSSVSESFNSNSVYRFRQQKLKP